MTVSIPCQQNTGNKSCILPCLTQKLANHRQQIIHLVLLRTDTTKSQATNRTSCHAPRCQQITGNNSYIFAMPHTDTSKSNVKRKSSRGNDLLRALGSASCDITHEAGDTSCDITHEPWARFVAMLTVCWNTKKQHVCDSSLP